MNAASVPTRLLISVDRYRKMGAAGVFAPDERVELIEGEIYGRARIGSRHAGVAHRLRKRLERAVGATADVGVGHPVNLGGDSEPQPDLLLMRPRADDYISDHPRAADILLLIEVSDSTLQFDQRVKRDLYAKHGIAEYWVVGVNEQRVTVYLDPVEDSFQRIHEYVIGDSVSPQAFPTANIALGELFA